MEGSDTDVILGSYEDDQEENIRTDVGHEQPDNQYFLRKPHGNMMGQRVGSSKILEKNDEEINAQPYLGKLAQSFPRHKDQGAHLQAYQDGTIRYINQFDRGSVTGAKKVEAKAVTKVQQKPQPQGVQRVKKSKTKSLVTSKISTKGKSLSLAKDKQSETGEMGKLAKKFKQMKKNGELPSSMVMKEAIQTPVIKLFTGSKESLSKATKSKDKVSSYGRQYEKQEVFQPLHVQASHRRVKSGISGQEKAKGNQILAKLLRNPGPQESKKVSKNVKYIQQNTIDVQGDYRGVSFEKVAATKSVSKEVKGKKQASQNNKKNKFMLISEDDTHK